MLIELRHLRYFRGVARANSISRASQALHVAQPALSRQIQELEREIGVSLFVRGGRGAALTDAGTAFLEDVDSILDNIQKAVLRAASVGSGHAGNLSLGFVGTATHHHFIGEGIRDFRQKYPAVSVKLRRMRSEANLAALRNCEIDVAICYHRPKDDPDLEGSLIEEEVFLLATTLHHPLAGAKTVALADISPEPLLWYPRTLGEETYDRVAAAFAANRLTPNVVQEGESEETLLELVAVGMGCTLVGSSVRLRRDMRNFALIPITDLNIGLRLELVWRRNHDGAVSRFLEVIGPLLPHGFTSAAPATV